MNSGVAHRFFCAKLIFFRAAADRGLRPFECELPRAALRIQTGNPVLTPGLDKRKITRVSDSWYTLRHEQSDPTYSR
jgi:hypothetical protein